MWKLVSKAVLDSEGIEGSGRFGTREHFEEDKAIASGKRWTKTMRLITNTGVASLGPTKDTISMELSEINCSVCFMPKYCVPRI